jgi:hypothetical protein
MKDMFNVPRQYKGENTYFGVFRFKNLLYTAITVLVSFVVFEILEFFGYYWTGLIIGSILTLIAFAIGTIKLPEDNLNSGGDHIDVVAYRWVKKKMNKVIYIDKKGFTGEISKNKKILRN